MTRVAAAVLVIGLGLPLSVEAQEPARPNSTPTGTETETVDATKLGVSLERIRRELRQAESKEQSGDSPLKLEFVVEVFGTAPRIDFLAGFPATGPVPYGPPTHREVLEILTPQAFRSPTIPISAMTYWAAQQLWKMSKKARCEAELAEYKQLVMQGVAVAAPRCTQ